MAKHDRDHTRERALELAVSRSGGEVDSDAVVEEADKFHRFLRGKKVKAVAAE